MSEIILSAPKDAELCIGGNALPDHKKMKNLDFESSGHTGFQKELSAQQLKNIDAVTGKEDKSNKAQDWNAENLTSDKYPSMEIVGARFDDDEQELRYVIGTVDRLYDRLQSDYQQKSEKVTRITENNSDAEYPSANAVNTRITKRPAGSRLRRQLWRKGCRRFQESWRINIKSFIGFSEYRQSNRWGKVLRRQEATFMCKINWLPTTRDMYIQTTGIHGDFGFTFNPSEIIVLYREGITIKYR